MKTNATKETIIKAVEIVSNEKYKGNVVFREKPHDLTKFTRKFTLRTKDKNKPGAFIDEKGRKQPKAHKDVYVAVAEQMFKLEPSEHIYVDFHDRRLYNENYKKYAIELAKAQKKEVATVLLEAGTKKSSRPLFPAASVKSTKTKEVVKSKEAQKFLESLEYVMSHKHLLSDPAVQSGMK